MVINLLPRLDRVDANARAPERLHDGLGDRPVLVLAGVQVEEGDVGPVVGEQQRQHRLGDLRVGRPGARKCGKVFLVRSITVSTKLKVE